MASGTFAFYGIGIQKLITGAIDIDTDTIKFALASSSYTPNNDTHDFWDDVNANEVTGTNWAAGGQTCTVTTSVDTTNNLVRFFITDISVATVTVTDGKYGILYKSTGTASTSPLIGFVTFGTALAPSAGTLLIDFDGTNGVGTFSY